MLRQQQQGHNQTLAVLKRVEEAIPVAYGTGCLSPAVSHAQPAYRYLCDVRTVWHMLACSLPLLLLCLPDPQGAMPTHGPAQSHFGALDVLGTCTGYKASTVCCLRAVT